MNEFKKNISSIFGKEGKQWLDNLLGITSKIAKEHNLSRLNPVNNMTFNYVASGQQGDNPIILKLGLDNAGLKREALALKCFAGCGAVKVLAEDNGMLLLERAVPGASLKSYFQNREQESIQIACAIMKKLHQASISERRNFPHIKDWLAALDKDWPIPDGYLQKARELRDQLLKTAGPDVLLHGDLHHENILQSRCSFSEDGGNDKSRRSSESEDGWLAIDPKGVIGESAYEVAAFIRNPIPELLTHANAQKIIHNRITRFAEALELPSQRILDWCFVQAVLSWAWSLEDNLDPGYCKRFIGMIHKQ